jgi:hypothetical protein
MIRRRAFLMFLGLAVTAGALAVAQDAPGPAVVEPPLLLFAECGGVEVPVALERPVTVGGATFTLHARDHRELRSDDFVLQYPAGYHFAYSDEGSMAMWTLTGSDATLMVFVTHAPMRSQALLDAQVAALARRFEGSTIGPCTLTLEGSARAGKRVRMPIGVTTQDQQAYAVALPDGRVLMVVIQDSQGTAGATAEAQALQAQVTATFRLTR